MFQIITAWNLIRPEKDLAAAVSNIKLRGYNKETFLTGEFASKLANEDVRPLSVSNIADKYCPTRRDLYFYKGANRLDTVGQQITWGGKAGYIVEEYVECVFKNGTNDTSNLHTSSMEKVKKFCLSLFEGRKRNAYTFLMEKGNNLHDGFIEEKSASLERLRSLEENSLSVKEGDTNWLLTLLNNNGRAELGIKILHSLLKENDSLDTTHVKIKEETRPHITQIGINSPATPDFTIPEFSIVGDIKTGVKFQPYFQLTCAGYALAHENEKDDQNDINWGIIYFFPTRNPTAYVRPITFTQIYIFPIDDFLRQWFLDIRDEAYKIISKEIPPDFPEAHKREQCRYCRFKDHCTSQGLELGDHER